MSVGIDGKLPGPVYVSRDDVASLATLAAISDLKPRVKMRQAASVNGTAISNEVRRGRSKRKQVNDLKPRHWNIAVGWTGQTRRGYENAEQCMEYIVKEQAKRIKSERRKQVIRNASPISSMVVQPYQRLIQRVKQRTVKPYGLFVLLPMLLLVYPTICSMMFSAGKQIPAIKNAALWLLSITQPMRENAMEYIQPMRENVMKYIQPATGKFFKRWGMKSKPGGLLID